MAGETHAPLTPEEASSLHQSIGAVVVSSQKAGLVGLIEARLSIGFSWKALCELGSKPQIIESR
jgi:hypothetical protein